jgi:hypothetical protein
MSFRALSIVENENLKPLSRIFFEEIFNPFKTSEDCSPNKILTISEGALMNWG